MWQIKVNLLDTEQKRERKKVEGHMEKRKGERKQKEENEENEIKETDRKIYKKNKWRLA